MDEPKFCVLCGVRPVGDGRVKTCSPECWEAFHDMRDAKWPVVLGASIQRACRRAEVAGLVRAADQATADMIDLHDDIDAIDDAIKRHNDALSRLARLAGGVA